MTYEIATVADLDIPAKQWTKTQAPDALTLSNEKKERINDD